MSGEPSGHLIWRLTQLAVPVAVGQLGAVAMGVTDAIVVGQLAPKELAWQQLGWTFNGPAMLGGIGLMLGVQVLAARAVGAGRLTDAGVALRKGIVIALVAGTLVAVTIGFGGAGLYELVGVPQELAKPASHVALIIGLAVPMQIGAVAVTNFLQALKLAAPPSVAMWIANGVNLALDLAFVPLWGAVGSAWATALTRAFLFAGLLIYVAMRRDLKPYLARASNEGIATGALLALGIAAALSGLGNAGAFAALGVYSARIGAPQIAAFGIAMGGILSLVDMNSSGYGTAGTVLASHAIGRGDGPEARRIGLVAIAVAMVGVMLCGAFCVILPEPVARLFTADPATIAALVSVMGLLALLMIPDGGQTAVDSLLRAHGVNWYPTVVRTASMLIAPVLAWWWVERQHHGLDAVVLALLIAVSVGYVLMLARLLLVKREPAVP